MKFDIQDPQGFTHRILIEGQQAFGAENLAHGLEPQQRKYVTQQVLAAAVNKQPLPFGFVLKEYL